MRYMKILDESTGMENRVKLLWETERTANVVLGQNLLKWGVKYQRRYSLLLYC